uniref:Uncharacterized protein n=1 Tax=Strongyloides papillosus TaxID=174720 RepID=A0A0N5BR52_STREA
MNVSKILTVFIIISTSCIVIFCRRGYILAVNGKPGCIIWGPIKREENVTTTLANNKTKNILLSVTNLCGKPIKISKFLPADIIKSNDLYVNFAYNISKKFFTKIIPKDCDANGVINRDYFICDFVTAKELAFRKLCDQLVGTVGWCPR